MRRSYVFRLRPSARQPVAMAACSDAHRELYNAALQERRDAWSHSKTRIHAVRNLLRAGLALHAQVA